MRLCLLLAFLAVLQLVSSSPHAALQDRASAAPPVGYAASDEAAPAEKCKDGSSAKSQQSPSTTVTCEKTVITIEQTVRTETKNGPKFRGDTKDTAAPPQTTSQPQTTTQTPTVPVTFTATTTTTPEPQTTAATQRPTAPTTAPTTTPEPQPTATSQRTTVPATVPTTTPEPQTTAATQRPTVPATLPSTTQKPRQPQLLRGQCNPDNCKPPNCTCMSTKPPGGLDVKDMPQFVMLTFDDAVTSGNMPFYRALLGDPKRRNKAGGCGIAATFFTSAEYTDYPLVNELYASGNEIALHSISHKTDPDYWNGLNTTQWESEVVDQRRMMERYANVPAAAIRGFRGPFLFTGGDSGFRMLHRHFDYDCTLVHTRSQPSDLPAFPFTFDFGFQDDCVVKNCPHDAYPGLWSMPLNAMLRGREMGGGESYTRCALIDACTPRPETSDDTFQYLRANFENFYNTNRAPMLVSVHEAWLKDLGLKAGYLRFVDWLLEKEDVYLVTVSEVLHFMRNPRPKSSYVQRHCPKSPSPSTCPQTTSCQYETTPLGSARYMRVCGKACPKSYPWVGNPDGN